MGKTIVIILACLLSLFLQYFTDIASVMTTALLFPNGDSGYIRSFTLAIVNVTVCYTLTRFCAFKWFRLDFNKVGCVANGTWINGISSGAILFGILIIYALCLHVNFIVLSSDKWGLSIFDALVNNGIGTAIGEELIFRGFLFSIILKLTNLSKATIISVSVFVIPHMVVFDCSIVSGLIFINYISISILLTCLYYSTKSLIAPIIYHAFYNFILYGIWNIIGTGEPSTAIFTQEYNTIQIIGYLTLSSISQIGISYFLLHNTHRSILVR